MSGVVKVAGIKFAFADRELVIPPLSLTAHEQLVDRLDAVRSGGLVGAASTGTIIDAVHAALKRNYPEMTRDEVGELLDLGNMSEALEAVMDVSCMKRKARDAAPGEAPPP